MALSASKLAPSAVVLAFVGYCSWPSVAALVSAPPPPPPPPKVPEVAAALFSPQLPPRPTKNPWGGLDAASLAAVRGSKIQTAGTSAAAKKDHDPLDGLRLEATCILGNQRMAMINGELYAPQPSPVAGRATTSAFRVISVLPEKVLLESKGRTVELNYEGIVVRSSASPKNKPSKIPSPKVGTRQPAPMNVASDRRPEASLPKKLNGSTASLQSGAPKKLEKSGN